MGEKRHPGHFWICLFLFCLTLNTCTVTSHMEKNNQILERIEAKMPKAAQ